MVTRVVTILLAAWLLMRIVIPVCAARMTSQVLELLLEPKIHLPGSRPKSRPGKYPSCCSIAVPLQDSGVTWFGWHDSGQRDSDRRHGLNHCWSCRNHTSSGVQLCVRVSTCAKARSGVFLPAAWLPKRIMIPMCAADITSQVPRLLLEHQIMHPPDSQAKFWSGQYLLCYSKLLPCRVAGQSPPLFLQRCEHDDMRTTIEETTSDSGHESPS